MPINWFYSIFFGIFKKSEEKVELHEKRLLIIFWRKRVRKSMTPPFVAVIMHLLSLCRNKCQLLDFIQIFQRTFQESEEKAELHEKCLLILFWKRRVRKSMIAQFVAVIIYFLGLCRNKCQLTDFIQTFYRIFKKSEEKVELHEKRLLITFGRRQVRKPMIAHFGAVIVYFLGLCRNKCQLTDFIQIFYRIFKKSGEKVKLHEKRLLIIFWRRPVRNSMIAHFVAVVLYLFNLCRNNANCWIFYKFFGGRQVRKPTIAHFGAVMIYFVGLCRNKCQLTDFIQIFYRIFKKSEEKVELHEKRLLIIFWRRRVRKSMIAHFVAVVLYLFNLCRNNANCWIFYKFFREFSKRVKKKSNFMKNVC